LNTDLASSTTLDFEIRPRFAVPDGATVFTESTYELLGGFVDPIFRGDFELEASAPSKHALRIVTNRGMSLDWKPGQLSMK